MSLVDRPRFGSCISVAKKNDLIGSSSAITINKKIRTDSAQIRGDPGW